MPSWRQRVHNSLLYTSAGSDDRPIEETFSCRLPSRFTQLHFSARITIALRTDVTDRARYVTQSTLAHQEVRDLAEKVAATRSPADPHGTALDVNRALLDLPNLSGQAISWARCELDVADDDIQRARERELAEHGSALLDAEHKATTERIDLLRTRIFTDGGRARLWWLSRYPDQVERIPQVGKALDEVVAAASADTGAGAGADGRPLVGEAVRLCTELMRDLDPEVRAQLGQRAIGELHRLFRACDRSDLSDLLGTAAEAP